MNNNDLVAKLWKLCDNLRDCGVSYQNYVNELASLLFLKMCKETGQEAEYLPEGYRWDDLKSRDRKSTRLNSSHLKLSRMPSSA